MLRFVKVLVETKKGSVNRLKVVSPHLNMEEILNFISDQLEKIIHHRNQLLHYGNLSIPIKSEPRSMNWHHQQISVHSGIRKYLGDNSYHICVSDGRKHDQPFVRLCLQEMVENQNIENNLVTESDNH